MRFQLAALAVLLVAPPAAAQPFIFQLKRDQPQAEQQPPASPVPVAPPQADATPGAPAQPDAQPPASSTAQGSAGPNDAGAAEQSSPPPSR